MNKDQINQLFKEGIFPEGDYGKRLIETYISWIIIGKKYVYKLKKPLKFSFLDFSTLKKRKYYCQEELFLNRRLTNGIYLNVLPVYKKDKYKTDKNKHRAIDYMIQMKKMNPSKQMNLLLKQNKVTKGHLKNIALIISEFHKKTQKIYSKFNIEEKTTELSDILTIKDFWQKNIDSEKMNKIIFSTKKSVEFLKKNEKLFNKRIEQGFTRDCHGDLHTKNIFLYKKPIIFDCIEFNPKYRQIDILNEIAFLCMDLEAFNKYELSSYFFKIYETEIPIPEKFYKLFIYFKIQKANVRAKVSALNAIQKKENKTFETSLNEATKYIDLMYSYAQIL